MRCQLLPFCVGLGFSGAPGSSASFALGYKWREEVESEEMPESRGLRLSRRSICLVSQSQVLRMKEGMHGMTVPCPFTWDLGSRMRLYLPELQRRISGRHDLR